MEIQVVNILLVDDRDDGLTALQAVLKQDAYNLVTAKSGAEALNLLSYYDFAVILLDVQMPEMDGFETANRIKQIQNCRYTPILFVTAINSEDRNCIYKGYEYGGAVDYIFKPFDGRILRSKVAVFVDLYLKSKKLEQQNQIIKDSSRQERVLKLAQLEVESLKRYQNLADSIPHIVWRAKPNGTMDYFNQVWMDYTGLTDQQSLGIGWQSAFQKEDLHQLLRAWMRAMLSNENFQAECRILDHTGIFRWHWISVVAEKNITGETIAWLGTCTDIEKRKYMELKLVETSKEAEAASLAKTQFLANMSHEIRTPLNSIIGFTDLILSAEHNSNSDQSNNLAIIKRSGQQLLKIIDEVLDISKVETGRLTIELSEVDLGTLLVDMKSILLIQAREKNIELDVRFLTMIPRKVITDATRYRQILTNLIGNALKFTSEGTVSIQFSWVASKKVNQGNLHCKISDTGPGINSNQHDRLFQPFMQVDSTTTRRFGGAGLGLSLSRRLAQALQGDVYLENSQPHVGSTFCAQIQATVPERVDYFACFADLEKNTIVSSVEMDTHLLGDAKILVVDDASDNRLLVSHFLKKAGAITEFATNGQEALDKALGNDYQLVLMDIQMPVMDGYSATRELRKQGYKKPIIALTAHALKEDRELSLNVGCDDYITKPIDRISLLNSISKYLKSSNANSDL